MLGPGLNSYLISARNPQPMRNDHNWTHTNYSHVYSVLKSLTNNESCVTSKNTQVCSVQDSIMTLEVRVECAHLYVVCTSVFALGLTQHILLLAIVQLDQA